MTKQPELSVADFFRLGNEAAAHTASLPTRHFSKDDRTEEEREALNEAD